MVLAVGSAEGAARGAVLSAAGDYRAAKRRYRHTAAGFSASRTRQAFALIQANRKRIHENVSTGESNASDDFRIGSGLRRDDRGRCARDGVRRVWPLRAELRSNPGLFGLLQRLQLA